MCLSTSLLQVLFTFSIAPFCNNMKQPKFQPPQNNIIALPPTRFHSSDFLPAIAHELKTPLSAIIALAEELRHNIDDNELIGDIISVANDMNELVYDLLDVSHIEDFTVDLSRKIAIENVLKKAIRLNRDYAIKRGILIECEVEENVSAINLDEKRTKQILTNLISNSIKYSPAKTKIKISAKSNDEFLEITIADQGFGMTKEQIQIAFQKYRTISNPHFGKIDSFGLGLPIVKRLVELQNGIIEVESEMGKGTEVGLKFFY